MTNIRIYDVDYNDLLGIMKKGWNISDPDDGDIADYIGELISAKKEELNSDTCSGECDYCMYKSIVPGTDERIDREPRYFCSLYEKI